MLYLQFYTFCSYSYGIQHHFLFELHRHINSQVVGPYRLHQFQKLKISHEIYLLALYLPTTSAELDLGCPCLLFCKTFLCVYTLTKNDCERTLTQYECPQDLCLSGRSCIRPSIRPSVRFEHLQFPHINYTIVYYFP